MPRVLCLCPGCCQQREGIGIQFDSSALCRCSLLWLVVNSSSISVQFSSVSRQFTTSKQLTVKTVCQQSDCRRLSFLSALCLFSQLPCAVCHLYECSTSVAAAVLFKPQIWQSGDYHSGIHSRQFSLRIFTRNYLQHSLSRHYDPFSLGLSIKYELITASGHLSCEAYQNVIRIMKCFARCCSSSAALSKGDFSW